MSLPETAMNGVYPARMFSVTCPPNFHISSMTSHLSSSMPTEESGGGGRETGAWLTSGQAQDRKHFVHSFTDAFFHAHIFNSSVVEFAAFPFLMLRNLHSFVKNVLYRNIFHGLGA